MEEPPLLRLPFELREQIYHRALHHPNGIQINLNNGQAKQLHATSSLETSHGHAAQSLHEGGHQSSLQTKKYHQHPAALTQTNRQIRRESHLLFYSLNTFHLQPMTRNESSPSSSDTPIRSASIGPWLQSLKPPTRAALKHINIDLGIWSPPNISYGAQPSLTALRPVPGQVAAYILCFMHNQISPTESDNPISAAGKTKCTFSLSIQFSDITPYGRFQLEELDFRTEEAHFGTRESVFECKLLEHAGMIAKANAEGRIQGLGVVMLMMGLDRCRSGFGEFLTAVAERVEGELKSGGM